MISISSTPVIHHGTNLDQCPSDSMLSLSVSSIKVVTWFIAAINLLHCSHSNIMIVQSVISRRYSYKKSNIRRSVLQVKVVYYLLDDINKKNKTNDNTLIKVIIINFIKRYKTLLWHPISLNYYVCREILSGNLY